MSNDQSVATEVSYRLACTTLHVTGVRESRTEWNEEHPSLVSTASISVSVEAERRGLIRVPQLGEDHKFALKLAPDGRLAGASNAKDGLLGEAIEATLGVVSFTVGLVGSFVGPRLPQIPAAPALPTTRQRALTEGPPADSPVTPEQRWTKRDPDGDATRLKSAVAALAELNTAVITSALQAATTDTPAATYRRLIALRAAIVDVQAQISAINLRRDAWHAQEYVTSETHVSQLPTDALFKHRHDALVPPDEIRIDREKGSASARAVLDELGIALVEIRLPTAADRATLADDEDQSRLDSDQPIGDMHPGIWFRAPRSALIALYKQQPDSDKLKLHSAEWYWLVDLHSQLNSFPLEGRNDLDVAATFTSDGLLGSLTMEAEGRLASILEALKAAPGQVAGGLEQAEKAATSWGTLRSTRSDRELAALEQRKKQLEAVVGARGLEADASSAETLQQVKDRLERLKTERDIGALESPPVPDEQTVRDTERREVAARLKTELQIAWREDALAAFKD